jgi:fluoroacetyl-CoA thioesterase
MKTIPIGASLSRKIVVDRDRTIDFLGEHLRVYATPSMVRDVEVACRDLLLQFCDPGEDNVGTGISLSHKGSTLLGMTIDVTVKVKAVEGRRVTFASMVQDGAEEISSGEHGRFVVDIEKVRARMAEKAAKAKG